MRTPVILIIDDSQIISEIISHTLEVDLKVKVVSFSSAEAAIQELDLYEPDIILLDYNLDSFSSNNMNGLKFLEKMKLRGKFNSIIMMSGQRDKKVTSAVLKSGAVDYLSKNDDDFLENVVAKVKSTLEILKIDSDQKKQNKELKKRVLRASIFILIPVGIAILCLYCQL